MFLKIRILFLISFLISFFESCYRDPFNVDLSEFEGNIVIEAIISNTELTLESNASANSTKTALTRRRAKLQESNKNISLFKLPYDQC